MACEILDSSITLAHMPPGMEHGTQRSPHGSPMTSVLDVDNQLTGGNGHPNRNQNDGYSSVVSENRISSKPESWKRYQATVEDDTGHLQAEERSKERRSPEKARTTPPPQNDNVAPLKPHVLRSSSPFSEAVHGPSTPMDTSSNQNPGLKGKNSPSRTKDQDYHVHFSHRAAPKIGHRKAKQHETRNRQNSSKPRAPKEGTGLELSPVDLKWGSLFDEKGNPTQRLAQILQSIGEYIICHYEPANSMVITPKKLYRLYKEYECEDEIIPFQSLLDCYSADEFHNLQCVFHDLKCEHHLVSAKPGDDPGIPALTPSGFIQWMTTFILANPSHEARRLGSIVKNYPLQAKAESGEVERLPKQLSRYLLPHKPEKSVRDAVLGAYEEAFQRNYVPREKIAPRHASLRRPYEPDLYIPDRWSPQHLAHRGEIVTRRIPVKRLREIEISKRGRSRHGHTTRRYSEHHYRDRDSSDNDHRHRRYRSPERSSRRRRRGSQSPRQRRHHSPPCTTRSRDSVISDETLGSISRGLFPIVSHARNSDHHRRTRHRSPRNDHHEWSDSEYGLSSHRGSGYGRDHAGTPRIYQDENEIRRGRERHRHSNSHHSREMYDPARVDE